MMYSIKDIQQVTKVSVQSLYKYIRKHKDQFEGHSVKKKQITYYDDYAYSIFIDKYCKDQNGNLYADQEDLTNDEESPRSTESSETEPEVQIVDDENKNGLESKISELEKRIEQLQQEKDEWKLQASQALLALSREQEINMKLQEKIDLLLPAPSAEGQDRKKHSLFGFLKRKK